MRILNVFICLLGTVIFCQAAVVNSDFKNPRPTGLDLYYMAGNPSGTEFVLVGEGGITATSTDTRSWQFAPSLTNETLRGVAMNSTTVVAVGDSGTILVRANGLAWEAVSSTITADLRAVTFGSGFFLAVGDDNGSAFAAISADGRVWTVVETGVTSPLNAATYYAGTFVVVGDGGQFARSLGGTLWLAGQIEDAANLVSVTSGGGQFVAVSAASRGNRIYSSSVGSSWNEYAAPRTADGLLFTSIAYHNGLYVITANNSQILTTSSIISWIRQEVNAAVASDYTFAFGSVHGWNLLGRGGMLEHSVSGVTGWNTLTEGASGTYNAIAFGDGYYVTVGDNGGIAGSADFDTWANLMTPTNSENLYGVTFGNGRWIAVGQGGAMLTSFDTGDNWTRLRPRVSVDLFSVAFYDNLFYAVGAGGAIFRSTDDSGQDWAAMASPVADDLVVIENVNGTLLAGTSGGLIIYSADGLSWDVVFTGGAGSIRGFAYFQNNYWALVSNATRATLYSSPDALSWAPRENFNTVYLTSLATDGNWLAAIGPTGDAVSSPNGLNWDTQKAASGLGLGVIANLDGRLAATGRYSKIAQLSVAVAWEMYFGPSSGLGSGWRSSAWLGLFNINSYPMIYHNEQGWWFCSGLGVAYGNNSFWIYDTSLGWIWTAYNIYPWLYVNNLGNWAYFGGTNNGFRSLFLNSSGRWQVFPMSGT